MGNKDERVLSAIEIAFTPASDIEIPKLFCGRQPEIVQGLKALRSRGASLCLHGARGVGKSSLSKQLMLVGAGLSDLPDLIQRPELFDVDHFKMPNVYFSCDSSITSTEGLFRRLVADRNSFSGIARFNGGALLKRVTTKSSCSSAVTIKLLSSAAGEEVSTESVAPDDDAVGVFKTVASDITDAAQSEAMIVVIDDFDLVADKVGIASVIKATPRVKFILVGVADDYRSLIADYGSVSRQLGEGLIHVGLMDESMLLDILARAEQIMADAKTLRFDDVVKARIAVVARGYPYWVHRLGKECCYAAVEGGGQEIGQAHYDQALRRVVAEDVTLEDLYREAVANDEGTEAVLRALAYEKGVEHSVRDLYALFKSSSSIDAARIDAALKRLERLTILRMTTEGFYNFVDLRFKGFAGFRPPVFKRNAEERLAGTDVSQLGELVTHWKSTFTYQLKSLTPQDILYSSQQVYYLSGLEGDPLLYDHSGKVLSRKETPWYSFGIPRSRTPRAARRKDHEPG